MKPPDHLDSHRYQGTRLFWRILQRGLRTPRLHSDRVSCPTTNGPVNQPHKGPDSLNPDLHRKCLRSVCSGAGADKKTSVNSGETLVDVKSLTEESLHSSLLLHST